MATLPAGTRLALASFDKVLLAGAATWTLSCGLAFASPPAELGQAERLRADVARLEAASRPMLPTATAPRWAEQAAARLAPPAAAQAFPAWALHKRPGLLLASPPPVEPLELVHEAPQVTIDAVERTRITLSLSAGRFEHVVHQGYRLERRLGDGPWRTVADLPAGAREHVDAGVAPRARYSYRLISLGTLDMEDPEVVTRGVTTLPAGLAEQASAATEAVETPRTLRFVVRSVTPGDPLRGRAGVATLVVERWDPAAGEFRGRYLQVSVGEVIADSGAVLRAVGIEEREVRPGWTRPVQWVVIEEPGHAPERLVDLDRAN